MAGLSRLARCHPRDRDLLRRHLRRGPRRPAHPLQRDLLAGGGPRAASAASCPRSPRATTSSWPRRWSRRRWARRGSTLDDVEAVAVTAGPGLIGALLVGVSTAKAIAAPRRLPLIPVDHLQGHVAANFLEPEPLEPPFLCLVASGGHTLLAGVRDHDGLRGARPDPRRRRRRGLRQGRAPARARLSRRPGAGAAGAEGATPRPSRCRWR